MGLLSHCSFGSGQISVSRHMGTIVTLLGDANSQVGHCTPPPTPPLLTTSPSLLTTSPSQVRSCAMETIVEIYRHVGVKVRIDLSKRSIPQSRMATLTARFDAIDAATNAVEEVGTEVRRHSPRAALLQESYLLGVLLCGCS